MDEFEIDDSLDTSFSDDSSLDSFESSGDAFDAMDAAEVPTIEDASFDSIESGNIEDYSYEDTELFNDEVSDVMNGVEVGELTFDDEPISDIPSFEVLESEIDQPIEEPIPDLIETMDDAEPEVLEFDEQVEGAYEATPNSEIEILQEDGTVDTLENIQAELEEEPEAVEQMEEPYEGTPNSEIEILQEDGTVDMLENIQEQLETESENVEQADNIGLDLESEIENATSVEELAQIRNQILQEGLPEQDTSGYEEFTTEEYVEDPPKTLTREITPEILESRNADTEEVLDNYRENLREYGVDEDAIEQFVSQEREKINAEYESLDRGDLDSNCYEIPTDWEGVASRLKEGGFEDTNLEENIDTTDIEIEPIDPSEIDYDEVFEGLDSYDFDEIDYLQDAERLDSSLRAFQPEQWRELDLNQQKEAMTELAEYVQEVTGLENPPTIEFYNNPVDGDYGGYTASTNTLSINEHMLYDSNEAADTVAHELWHAYQHERAMNPQSAKDYQYQYNFEHYISPKRDMFGRFVNFTEYQDQLVEAEARAFAEQFKGRLGGYGGAN